MSFDLRQLKAFEAVARHGGFSRASEEVGLTQPTLSTHIRNLEDNLGARLFDRASRSVSLTPTGVLLADYARKILALYEESIEAIEAFTGNIRGTIHVQASTVPGEYLLPRWLVNFHRRYPEVQVILTVSDSAVVFEKIEGGEIAVGVTGSPGNHASVESRLLCEDTIVLVRASGSVPGGRTPALEIQELFNVPLIRREPGSGTQLALDNTMRQQGIDPESLRTIVALGSTRAVIEGVLAGLGWAFVSRSTVTRELEARILEEVPVNGLSISRGLYAVRHKRRTLSPAASCFLEELVRSGLYLAGDPERS
ncbi:MAG: LysR family transcriptional regulator [bacterium]|nr:MAG: LysR family transcriptional regulator [bacterium]